jgi:hypothetical protein
MLRLVRALSDRGVRQGRAGYMLLRSSASNSLPFVIVGNCSCIRERVGRRGEESCAVGEGGAG